MKKRSILISGLAITLLISGWYFIPNNGIRQLSSVSLSTTPTLTIGTAQQINYSSSAPGHLFDSAGRFDYPNNMDMSAPTLKKNSTEFYTWTQNGQFSMKKSSGTIENPFRDLVWSEWGMTRWDFSGVTPDLGDSPNTGTRYYRPWMANVYKVPGENILIGFVHIETDVYRPEGNNYRFRMGLAVSRDNGDHWKYIGDILKPEKDAWSNMGGTPLLIVGDYMYLYFNEVPNSSPRIPAVARARISDVVAAAKNNAVTPWIKYNKDKGGWTQNGLTGVASNITWNIDNATGLNSTSTAYPDRYDMHTDSVYSTALGKYLLIAWEQSGWSYFPPYSRSDSNKGLYLYTSNDGINWSDRKHIFTPTLANAENPYVFFAGGLTHPDTTDDFNVIGGNEFYLYVPDRNNDKLYKILFSVENGVVTPPKKIMPLGDSITQANGPVTGHPGFPGGYRKRLGELLSSAGIRYDFVGSSTVNPAPGIDPDHNGYPGYRTDQILANLPTWLSTSDPDIVLLHIGTNDLLQHKTTASAINNLRQIVRQILSDSSRKLYIAKIIPILDSWENLPDHPEYNTPAYWKPIVDGYNQAIQNMLLENEFKNNPNIQIVDMTGEVADPATGESCAIMLCETFDGLHPAQKGLNRMGILWYGAITGTTPPIITSPIPVITSPTVEEIFPSNTSTVNLEWNTVTGASGYHLRVIEYTDASRTTQTARRYAGNTSSSPFYVYIDNHASTSLPSLPVDTGKYYRFWIHSVINGVISDGKEVFFSVNSGSVVVPKVLTANVVGQGVITSTPAGISCGSDCTESYSANETITFNVSATSGYTFTGWSGACSGTGACSVSMTENRTVTATFTPITYTLTTSTVGQGNITGNTGSYNSGATATITANPLTGYKFKEWSSGACTGINPICTITMDSDKNTTATFIEIPTGKVCKPWN